jgi:hypothetical protein
LRGVDQNKNFKELENWPLTEKLPKLGDGVEVGFVGLKLGHCAEFT